MYSISEGTAANNKTNNTQKSQSDAIINVITHSLNTKMKCALCSDEATTREHLIKKTVVEELMFDTVISNKPLKIVRPKYTRIVQGAKSDSLKYPPNLCQNCNGRRSQPYDRAYSLFISYIIRNEKTIASAKKIYLDDIKHLNKEHLFKYFIKAFCCMIDSTQHTSGNLTLSSPPELLKAFHGGSYGQNLIIRFCSHILTNADPMRKYIRVSNPIYTPSRDGTYSFIYSESFGWFQIWYIYQTYLLEEQIWPILSLLPNYWDGKSKEINIHDLSVSM